MIAKPLSFYNFAMSEGCKSRICDIIRYNFPEPPETSWVDRIVFKERFDALKNGYVFTPQIILSTYFGFDSEELESILIELSDGNRKKCEMIFNKANKTICKIKKNKKNLSNFYNSMTAKDLVAIFLSVQELVD